MSGPNRTVTPHDRSLAMLSVNAGCAAWAWLLKGTATSGSFLPIASTKIPRARVSQMPAAHLLIVFTVAGAMMIASGAGRTSGSSGSLYSLRTGYPVRSEYKEPDEPDVLPAPDAIIIAPATVNTINKWAAGICDTLALGILVEAIGKKLPLVAVPFSNHAHAAHPAFTDSIAKLRSWGVTVLFGPDIYPLHDPGTGSRYLHLFPWGKYY